jgi:phosphohistidine swiveling domain-containing protein
LRAARHSPYPNELFVDDTIEPHDPCGSENMSVVASLAAARDPARFGEKTAALAALCTTTGVKVPPGFAIAAEYFRSFIEASLPQAQWPERLVAGPESQRREDKLVKLRAALARAPLPEPGWREIVAMFERLDAPLVAVRSSSLSEDTRSAAGAGVFSTVLGVRDVAGLERAVRTVFERLFDERALSYLARMAPRDAPSMALLVQRVVDATSAGVLFTEDPVRRASGTMRVEATIGLGSTVVDGVVAPDVWVLSREDGSIVSEVISDKHVVARLQPSGGTQLEKLDPPARTPSLDHAQLHELAGAARAVERVLGARRDIEFAFDGPTPWIVQARPIVQPHELDDARSRWVWSNVNVGEALPGVATPLTWSIAAAFSDHGFRRAFGALGCDVPDDVELVGRFDGRIYLNLTHFLSIAAQVPALDPRQLLEFGGGGGVDEVVSQIERGSWASFLLRVPAITARYIAENAELDQRVEVFERDATRFRDRFDDVAFGPLTRAELALELESVEAMLDRTGALMLTCASGVLSSVVLVRTLLRVTVRADAEQLERALLSGNAELESALPGIALAHIAAGLDREPAARAIIEQTPADRLSIDALPEGRTRRSIEAFLRAYGFRAPREAELSTPRWREDPTTVFAALRAHAHGTSAPLARVDAQIRGRERAESAWLARLSSPLRPLARRVLARARKFLKLRERMRAHVTEVLGYFRTLALEVSRRLERFEPECGADGAFFLSIDEVREFLRGGVADVAALVRARRAEYLRDCARPDPPNSFVGAPPIVSAQRTGASRRRLQGIGASAGRARGAVRILREPKDGAKLRPGEILVVPVADVGWTPLFLTAAGVVTELGGALSHASLVAREYGVATVVNVDGASRVLRDGELVEVDGHAGTVDRLDPEPDDDRSAGS